MKRFFCILTITAILVLAGKPVPPSHAEGFSVNSLWVPCESAQKTLDDIQKIDALIDFSLQNNVDTLFIQIYRGNRTWYSTDMADDTPAQNFLKKFEKDMLSYLLEKAHASGITVHAWFNVLRVTTNVNAPILKKYGKNIVTRDSRSRNLMDYPGFKMPEPDSLYYDMGDPGIWLDAGHPDVQKYLSELMKDFLLRYNEIDGIHLDFIRLPSVLPASPGSRFKGISFGYGYESIKKFREQYGFDPIDSREREQAAQWDDFRREQITDIVKEFHNLCQKRGKTLSAAVRPWIARAYLNDCQDWPAWLEQELIDFAVVMNYTDDFDLFKYLSLSSTSMKRISPSGSKIIMGIGTYLLKNKQDVLEKQIRFLKEIDADGICIFSYDSIEDPEFVYSIINE